MRFFSLLFVAASALLVTAKQSIQPDLASIQSNTSPAPAYRRSHHERITNAMRLRRGLPVLPPRHLAGTPTKRDGIHSESKIASLLSLLEVTLTCSSSQSLLAPRRRRRPLRTLVTPQRRPGRLGPEPLQASDMCV